MSKGKIVWYGILAVAIITILIIVGAVAGWFGEAAEVAYEELSPRALLEKYEWFKKASATLDEKIADIGVYEGKIDRLEQMYTEDGNILKRTEWARSDVDTWNLWQSEVSGIKASFNLIASDYNEKMAEIHWAFANVGELPKGADEPLPREYKKYITE